MNEEPQTSQHDSDFATWTKEYRQRRSEAVAVALRNFVLSRQFLTEGKLSESEKLIRFFEGVTMSLQPDPDEKAAEEAQAAFRSVLRYHSVTKLDIRDNDSEQQVLFIQAHCNLAVSAHRQWLRSPISENKEVFETARMHYIAAIRESNPFDFSEAYFPRADRGDGDSSLLEASFEREMRSCARRRLATALCATVGILNLLLSGGTDLAVALYKYRTEDNSIVHVTPSLLLQTAASIAETARTWQTLDLSTAPTNQKTVPPQDQGANGNDQGPRVDAAVNGPPPYRKAQSSVSSGSVINQSAPETTRPKSEGSLGIRRILSSLFQNFRPSTISTAKAGKASADLRERSVSRALVEELAAIRLAVAQRLGASAETEGSEALKNDDGKTRFGAALEEPGDVHQVYRIIADTMPSDGVSH
jgi:hypothetical protein